jgi:hypothetical protein
MLQGIAENMASSAKGNAENEIGQSLDNATSGVWFKYCLTVFMLGFVISTLAFIKIISAQNIFLLNLVLFSSLGIWHWVRMRKQAAVVENFVGYLVKVSIISFILIYLGYLLGYFLFAKYLSHYFIEMDFIWLLSFSSLATLIPMFFELVFEAVVSIPPKDYDKWLFPNKPIILDMEGTDLSNVAVITFVFSKKYDEKVLSNLQSKGPYSIKLGDLFYFFIEEWNHRNPENTLQYLDDQGNPFGWYFTVKKSFWSSKRYLDPKLTIRDNKISVNAIINTERIYLSN